MRKHCLNSAHATLNPRCVRNSDPLELPAALQNGGKGTRVPVAPPKQGAKPSREAGKAEEVSTSNLARGAYSSAPSSCLTPDQTPGT